MRRTALAAACLALLCAAGTASASQVDVLWFDGDDQFDRGPHVAIWPYAGGDKVALGGDTSANAARTQQLVIENYSRTWDASAESIGAKKQADIFLTFQENGISSYTVSLRFDSEGDNMLNVLAIREYNVDYGNRGRQVDNGGPFSGVNTCEPFNNCASDSVSGSEGLPGFRIAELNNESEDGVAGYLYRFASIALSGGPESKNSELYGTVRIGSVLFELNSIPSYGSGELQVGFFLQPGTIDSIVNNNVELDPELTVDSGAPSIVHGATFCGDEIVQEGEGETCDDGNRIVETCPTYEGSCMVCGTSCTDVAGVTRSCGDGVHDPEEDCDDGNEIDDDECSNSCTLVGVCGNELVEEGEVCDDGNMVDDDYCTNDCQMEGSCGDSIVQAAVETCDDGNMDDGDLCSSTCVFLVDSCETALLVDSLPFVVTGTTLLATADGGDPTPSCGTGSDGVTIWFDLPLDSGDVVSIDTSGSDYDTVVSIYTAACVDPTEQACNDDGMPPQVAGGAPIVTSYLVYTATASTTYGVMVGSRNAGDGGDLMVEVLKIPEPALALLGIAGVVVLSELRRRRRR